MAHEPRSDALQIPTPEPLIAPASTQLAVELAPIGIAIATCEGQLCQVNPAFCALLGYEAAALVGRSYGEVLHPEEREIGLAALRQIALAKSTDQLELRYLNANGEVIDALVQVGAGTDFDNSPPLLIIYVMNATTHPRDKGCQTQPQDHYKSLIHSIEGIFWEADAQTFEYTFISFKVQEILGYSPEQWLSSPSFWIDHIHPDDRDRILAFTRAEVQAQRDHECEYRMIAADGRWVWLHDVVNLIELDDCVLYARGISLDITKRKAVEERLQLREETYRALVENAPDLILRLNREFRFLYVNPKVETLADLPAVQYLDKTVGELGFPRHLVELWCDVIQQVFITGEERSLEYEFRSSNGMVYMHSRLVPEFSPDGEVASVLVIGRDVSELKRAQLALIASEAKFAKAFRASPDPITLCTFPEWRFIDINDSFLTALGYSRDDVVGKTSRELAFWVYPDEFLQVHHLLEHQGFVRNQEVRFRTGSGQVKTYLLSAELVELNGQQCLLSVGKDISDRKRSEDERKQAEESLHRQVEREYVVAEITRRIRQSLKLEAILTTTVGEVRQFLKADRVVVYRFSPDWNGQVIVESVKPGIKQVTECNIQDNCLQNNWYQPYLDGRIGVIEDLHRLSDKPLCYVNMLKDLQIRANLVVPIVQGNMLWGLLVAHQCNEPRQWQMGEIDFLKQLASQMAIAIQQSELYEQVQRLNATLERQVQERTKQLQQASNFEAMLKRITDRVRDSLDEDQILQNAVEEMGRVMSLQGCNAALYNVEEKVSQIRYEYTTLSTPFQGYTMQMVNFKQGYDQLLQGHYFQFCSLSSFPERGQVAMLACPILDDQEVLGDLWLINHTDYEFNEQDIKLTQQVANQCAIALRQARLYKQAQNQVEKLEQLNYLKDDFLSTVSHELRTPMANIKMATQMLEISLERLGVFDVNNTAVLRYFRILKDEGQREISLINDLLDLSRLDAGTSTLFLSQAYPDSLVNKIVQPFLERALNQQQTLQVWVPNNLPAVRTDLTCLERVLTELLNNACKYTPSGETITLAVRSLKLRSESLISMGITTTNSVPVLRSAEPYLEITISNTGINLPDVELSHLFDKFYRVPNNDPWKHGGTGLGLALVKRLVEHLGGTVDVKNPTNQLMFVVQLPKLREAFTANEPESA